MRGGTAQPGAGRTTGDPPPNPVTMMELGAPNASTGRHSSFGAQNGSVVSWELQSALQPSPLEPWEVVLCVSGTVISCENAAVLAVLAVLMVTPSFRAPTFLLTGSLAAADLLVGLSLVVRFASIYLAPSEPLRLGTAGLLLTACTASVCTVLAIAAERFVSLRNALTYSSARAGGRTRLTVLLTWGASLCCGLLPALRWNCVRDPSSCGPVRPLSGRHLAAFSVSILAAFAVLLQLYAHVCRIARRHARLVAAQQRQLAGQGGEQTSRRGAATLLVTLGAFASCWLPFAALCLSPRRPPAHLPLLPAAASSVLNPLIYAFRTRELRKVLWALCCGCRDTTMPFRSRSPTDV
ncbi:G-protein coupled receptor 3 [Excalfactoria chinensis]|uniref:G-protein coupled receptor 3 n=1 Tax=Excalfactoria chinensis TaxID=46218 RepID=UPI003B3BBB48